MPNAHKEENFRIKCMTVFTPQATHTHTHTHSESHSWDNKLHVSECSMLSNTNTHIQVNDTVTIWFDPHPIQFSWNKHISMHSSFYSVKNIYELSWYCIAHRFWI